MFFVYILESLKNKKLYIGYTRNLKKRLAEHNSGKSKATKPHRPYKMIYHEAFLNKKDAKKREVYLKSGWGKRTIKRPLKYFFNHGPVA